jgi:hypothetical protein
VEVTQALALDWLVPVRFLPLSVICAHCSLVTLTCLCLCVCCLCVVLYNVVGLVMVVVSVACRSVPPPYTPQVPTPSHIHHTPITQAHT